MLSNLFLEMLALLGIIIVGGGILLSALIVWAVSYLIIKTWKSTSKEHKE